MKKKPVAKKLNGNDTSSLVEMFKESSLWSMACSAEESALKYERVALLLDLIAEKSFMDCNELIWLASDLIREENKKLDRLQKLLMDAHVANKQ